MDEAVARVREALERSPTSVWLRGRGWRSGDWTPPIEPTKEALDAIAPDRPVALMARDSHSVWLNSAALAHANGDLQVPGGVVELDEHGEPTGVLREESCWHFRDRYIETTDDEYVEAMRAGVKLAASRGVTAVHDKDGWLGALRFWQRLAEEGALSLRVWQSLPAEKADELAEVDVRSGFGDPLLKVGYLKAFMDGTLGSQTARLLDGSGVQITSREELEEHIRRAPAPASRSPSTRSATSPTARRSTPSRRRARSGSRSACASASSTRSCSRRRTCRASPQLGIAASVQFSHAPSDRDLADRIWGGTTSVPYAYRSLLDSGATLVNGSDAPIEELDPLRGICAPACCERSTSARRGTRSRR